VVTPVCASLGAGSAPGIDTPLGIEFNEGPVLWDDSGLGDDPCKEAAGVSSVR